MAFHQVSQEVLEQRCVQSGADPSSRSAMAQLSPLLPHPWGSLKDRQSIFLFTVSISILISLNQAMRIYEIPSVRGFAERVTSHPPKLCVCVSSVADIWSTVRGRSAFRNGTGDSYFPFKL